jgi:hypothetical protein
MTLLAVQQQRDRLDAVFELVERLQKSELPVGLLTALTAHLTQYLCVRVSGFIEQAAQQILTEHARLRSGPTVASFVSRRLDRQQNLNSERLCQLVEQFDSSWGDDLRQFLGEDRKAAIESIVANRHKIAHGESVSLGFVQLREWYRQVLQVVEQMERQALP